MAVKTIPQGGQPVSVKTPAEVAKKVLNDWDEKYLDPSERTVIGRTSLSDEELQEWMVEAINADRAQRT
ncbi:hypothetical protein SEA_WELCOME_96 [Microbacterium phage Welcome]|nr:hypothetical protein SEA_WELCOME_96 [Microbacterium phage Welcome]